MGDLYLPGQVAEDMARRSRAAKALSEIRRMGFGINWSTEKEIRGGTLRVQAVPAPYLRARFQAACRDLQVDPTEVVEGLIVGVEIPTPPTEKAVVEARLACMEDLIGRLHDLGF